MSSVRFPTQIYQKKKQCYRFRSQRSQSLECIYRIHQGQMLVTEEYIQVPELFKMSNMYHYSNGDRRE